MSNKMNEVKNTIRLRSEAKTACTLRIVLSILIGPGIVAFVYSVLEKLFSTTGNLAVTSLVSQIWEFGGTLIVALLTILYIYRTSIRKWSYSYMLDYRDQAQANGFTVCPRCGSKLRELTQQTSYRVRVGDTITTTTFSDGSTSRRVDPLYETRHGSYNYFACTNPSCGIISGHQHLGKIRYRGMPATKKQACALILGSGNYSGKKSKRSAHKLMSAPSLMLIALVVIVAFGGIRLYQFNNMRYTGNSVLNDGEELTRDAAMTALDSFDTAESGLDNYTISIIPKTSFLKFAFFKAEPATVMKTTEEGEVTYYFDLTDYDCGTELSHDEYYITRVDGQLAIVRDYIGKELYPEGSKKFEEIYPKLMALTYEQLINTDVYRKTGESIDRQKAKQKDGKIIFDYGDTEEKGYVRKKLLTEENRASFFYNSDKQKLVYCFFSYGDTKIEKMNTHGVKTVTE